MSDILKIKKDQQYHIRYNLDRPDGIRHQNYFSPNVTRWRMPAAAQNVSTKNGYGTPGERRQDG